MLKLNDSGMKNMILRSELKYIYMTIAIQDSLHMGLRNKLSFNRIINEESTILEPHEYQIDM